jgi:HD-like signal output (HDOD) protein
MDDMPAPIPAPIPYLNEPLSDLAAWTRYFCEAEIPILASTSEALETLRAAEDDVDAAKLTAVIQRDPFMTIKLMALVAAKRKPGESTETETVMSALVMMGVSPFFAHFGKQLTVEDRLQDQPKALEGLMFLLKRAKRAAHFAMAFAVHRGDTDAAVLHQAAFLHDFAEMLMWCHAPAMEFEIHEMQRVNPTLRSASLQRFVFNIDLSDLRQELMKIWHLPELLVRISDGKHPSHPNVRNVLLAGRLARHTMNGWTNAALPDDIRDIAVLLNAAPRVVLAYLQKIDHPDPEPESESVFDPEK